MHEIAMIYGFAIAFIIAIIADTYTKFLTNIDSHSNAEIIAVIIGFVMLWALCGVGVYALRERPKKTDEG